MFPNARFTISLCLLMFFTLGLSGQQWTEIATDGSPDGRSNASAVYNSRDNTLVIFGGRTKKGFVNDLWQFDLDSETWTQIETTGDKPFPRHTQNAMYDYESNRMFIYSGQGTEGLTTDIWSFDFEQQEWEEIAPNSDGMTGPSERYGTAAVFDRENDRIVVFGGFASVGRRQDDTWAFDLSSDTWSKMEVDPFPLERCLHSTAIVEFASSGQRTMVIYGGQNSDPLDDMWLFDLKTDSWTGFSPDWRPPGRLWAPIVSRSGRNIYVFGGNGAGQGQTSGVLNDMWLFSLSNGTWQQVEQESPPTAREGHNGIELPCIGKILYFGGRDVDGNYLNDLWLFRPEPQPIPNEASLSGGRASYCTDDSPDQLVGTPSEGVFTGNISPDGIFEPALLGPGTHTFTYTLEEPRLNGCRRTASRDVIIEEAPAISRDSIQLCQGETFAVGGFDIEGIDPGIREVQIPFDMNGPCDSTVIYTVLTLVGSQTTLDTFLLAGSIYAGVEITGDTILTENLLNSNGCDSIVTTNITLLTTTSVSSPAGELVIQIYPNPFTENAVLEIQHFNTQEFLLDIHNAAGHRIYNKQVEGSRHLLPATDFAPGLYLYRVSDNTGRKSVGKFVVH